MIVMVLPTPVLNVKGADNIINLNELAPFKGRTKQEVAAKYQNIKMLKLMNTMIMELMRIIIKKNHH